MTIIFNMKLKLLMDVLTKSNYAKIKHKRIYCRINPPQIPGKKAKNSTHGMETMNFTILHYEHNGSTLRPDQGVMNFTCLVDGQFLLDDALQWTKTNGKWSPE